MLHLTDNMRSALFMTLAMAGYALNDTMMKLSSEVGLYQAIFLRGVIVTSIIGAIAWHSGAFHACYRLFNRAVYLRTLGELGGTIFFLNALFNIPFVNATSILQTLPLVVTLGASWFFGEKVGWRRYSAILIGFTGVLIIIRPGINGFNIYAFSALIGVFFIALRDLATRNIANSIPSILVAFVASLAVTIMGGVVTLTTQWETISLITISQLTASALFVFIGYIFSILTMRVGEISFAAPFRYTVLLWATLSSIFVFAEIPDWPTWLGSAIVVVTGLYTFSREQKLQKRKENSSL